jgi:hypothetical protein
MTRSLVLAVAALVLTAASGALASLLGWASVPVVPGALLVAYAAIVDPPISAAFSAALVGFVIDCLCGTPIGVSILGCVAALVASRFFVGWVTSTRGLPAVLFAGGLTFTYGLVALSLLFLFQRRESFGFGVLATATVVNAIAAPVVFRVAHGVLVLARVEERDASLQDRLAGKTFGGKGMEGTL